MPGKRGPSPSEGGGKTILKAQGQQNHRFPLADTWDESEFDDVNHALDTRKSDVAMRLNETARKKIKLLLNSVQGITDNFSGSSELKEPGRSQTNDSYETSFFDPDMIEGHVGTVRFDERKRNRSSCTFLYMPITQVASNDKEPWNNIPSFQPLDTSSTNLSQSRAKLTTTINKQDKTIEANTQPPRTRKGG